MVRGQRELLRAREEEVEVSFASRQAATLVERLQVSPRLLAVLRRQALASSGNGTSSLWPQPQWRANGDETSDRTRARSAERSVEVLHG